MKWIWIVVLSIIGILGVLVTLDYFWWNSIFFKPNDEQVKTPGNSTQQQEPGKGAVVFTQTRDMPGHRVGKKCPNGWCSSDGGLNVYCCQAKQKK